MKILNFIFFLIIISNLSGTKVSGSIKNSTNGNYIPNANIYFSEYEGGIISDAYGYFEIEIPQGQYTINITNIGFRPYSSILKITNENISLSIDMDPVILEFGEISVEGLFSTRLGYESANIISRDEFELSEKQSGIDMLRMLPGVEVQFAHPNGRNANLSIRGSSDYKPGGYNNRVLILLDGFPILIPNSGTPDWSSIPLEAIERIEVDNSPASAQYGHNSMGGVINLITDYKDRPPPTKFSIGAGTFSTLNTSFNKKFMTGNWQLGFNGMTRFSNGHRNNSDDQLGRLRSYLKYNDKKGRSYRLSHIISSSNIGHPGFSSAPSFRRSERISNYLQGHGFYPILEGLSMSHSVYINTFQTRYYDSQDAPLDKLEGERFYNDISIGLRSEALMTRWERWIIMIGADSDWSKSKVTVFNPIYDSPYQLSLGSFVQTKYSIGNGWSLGLGYRYDYRLTDPGNNYKQRTYSNNSPKLNLLYMMKHKRSFTISYSEGFRAPSLSELYLQHISSYGLIQQGNPNVLPERVRAYEISYEHPHSTSWIWSLSTFYNKYENMIDFVYTLPVRAVNRKGVNGIGFEYQFKYIPNEIFSISGQYSYLDIEDKEGIPVLYRSRHRAQLSFALKTKLIDCLLSSQYWSEQYYDDFLSHDYNLVGDKVIFPIEVLPEQNIPDLVLSRKIGSLDISIRISNLFNKKYELIQDYPMPGRSLHGKLTKTI